jgi:hypothetical protein
MIGNALLLPSFRCKSVTMSQQHLAILRKLGKTLRVHYGRVVEEPWPHKWRELISALYERDRLDQVRHTIRRDPRQPRLYERKLLIADRLWPSSERKRRLHTSAVIPLDDPDPNGHRGQRSGAQDKGSVAHCPMKHHRPLSRYARLGTLADTHTRMILVLSFAVGAA